MCQCRAFRFLASSLYEWVDKGPPNPVPLVRRHCARMGPYMTFGPNGCSWKFLRAAGGTGTVADSGSTGCHA